jgi:hypothetical protein
MIGMKSILKIVIKYIIAIFITFLCMWFIYSTKYISLRDIIVGTFISFSVLEILDKIKILD